MLIQVIQMLLVVRNLLLQLLKLLLLFLPNVEVLVGLLAFAEGVPISSKNKSAPPAKYRPLMPGFHFWGEGFLPLSRAPRPGCPGVSFAHSASGSGDGSAGWV